MQTDIKTTLYQAETDYLNNKDISLFKSHTANMAKRLEVYKLLRDREIAIFQPIADEVLRIYSAEDPQLVEKALKHWLLIMRYCAMAMLLNNPEYLQKSILEWLTEMVQAYQMQSIENTIHDLLFSHLKKALPSDRFALIQPFLEQTQTILSAKTTTTAGA